MKTHPIPAPVLVTGAGGLIGSAILRELDERNVLAKALIAPGESDENARGLASVSIVRGDVRDIDALRAATSGCRSVIHAAALNTLWHRPARDFYSVNVRGTKNALRAAREAGAEIFVHTSSCEVYGRSRRGVTVDEGTPLEFERVKGHYERSKFLAEMVLREDEYKDLKIAVIRPTAVVGPRDIHGSPPAMLIRAFLEGHVPAYYDAGINVVDSRDVAAVHVAVLERASRGEFIAGGHNVRLGELFSELARASGMPAPSRRVGYATALAAAAVRSLASFITGNHPGITVNGIRTIRHPWHFDISKTERELGLKPRPLADTVRDAVEWHLNSVTRDS